MSATCAALLVAAPASGQGKTTVTAALARLHARAGRQVRVFKCGPDFLDPFWHELATGAPVYQMDLWMTGEQDIRQRLHDAAREADVILIEGVMGLYDGDPSAADLARLLGLPVLAVVDASAMAQTFGALAHGLRTFSDGGKAEQHGALRWAGVLANRVGSERHAAMLADATPDFLGAVMRSPAWSLPERHLGLVAAQELPDALARLDAVADALAATPLGQLPLDAWRSRWSVTFDAPRTEDGGARTHQPLAGKTVALARDAAMCFVYQANLDLLRRLGAHIETFSVLADSALPACDAVWLPGGYPELHAATLSANHAMRDALHRHVQAGLPVWAECGGMMLLFDRLVDKAGTEHAMWGLLPGTVTMQSRLSALGPQQLALARGSLRGHTFHWSTVDSPLQPLTRTTRPGVAPQPVATAQEGEALFVQGPVRASYFHAWLPSAPLAAASLFLPEPLEAAA